jgi:hypothetical protein
MCRTQTSYEAVLMHRLQEALVLSRNECCTCSRCYDYSMGTTTASIQNDASTKQRQGCLMHAPAQDVEA